jgi:hypothetical protein
MKNRTTLNLGKIRGSGYRQLKQETLWYQPKDGCLWMHKLETEEVHKSLQGCKHGTERARLYQLDT